MLFAESLLHTKSILVLSYVYTFIMFLRSLTERLIPF
jgi:hypothetical protein